MNRSARTVFFILLGLAAVGCSHLPGGFTAKSHTAIVVNLGSFKTAQDAVAARDKVDWSVAEGPDTIVCTEALAALELHNYLCKVTGLDPADAKNFPIVDDDTKLKGPAILVGNARSNKQVAARAKKLGLDAKEKGKNQTYRMIGRPDMNPPVLVLAGADRIGTLYAAYGYLDRLGVRWYGPGEMNEYVPPVGYWVTSLDSKNLQTEPPIMAIDVIDGPKFFTRGFWAWEDRGTPEFIEWMGRNRMNFWTVEQTDPANAKMRGIQLTCGSHDLQTKYINHDSEYPYYVPEFPASKGKPADPYPKGDYKGDQNGDGILQYKEVHPEWYGMKKGKRMFNMRGDAGTNICDSNPDGVAEFMKNVVNALSKGKWALADSINFWMFDGYNCFCDCAECQKLGSHTDRNMGLILRLRAEIDKARKDGRLKHDLSIQFLTYADIIEPPTKPLPADFDYNKCQPIFFPIDRCYVHTFADPKCSYNQKYFGNYLGWAEGDSRTFKGQMFVGEYYNVSHFNHLPVVLDEIMRADIPWYYRHGARHMHYMHTPVANWGTRTLTQWQLARMLWNPMQDVDKLLDDYYAGRYGEAADGMRDFYGSLRTAMCNSYEVRYPIAANLMKNSKQIFTSNHMQYQTAHFDKDDGPDWDETMAALKDAHVKLEKVKAMRLPDDVRKRIAEDDGLFTYGENQMNIYDRIIATRMALNAGDKQAAREAYAGVEKYSKILEADTKSMQWGSTHVNRKNGLDATRLIPGGRGNARGTGLPGLAEEMKKLD
ncbi:DUF4838 domain-containing protein [bacterium]|nr:DUF4838 domain-containing protein [bacterium]